MARTEQRRSPPGQYLTKDFPVLSAGPTPHTALDRWSFSVGRVGQQKTPTVVLAAGYHPRHSVLGIVWTSVAAVAMLALAYGKARTGGALGNPVLQTEGRVTLIDGILATAVLLGLVLNAALGWWWADPAAGYVLVFYAAREVREIFSGEPGQAAKT